MQIADCRLQIADCRLSPRTLSQSNTPFTKTSIFQLDNPAKIKWSKGQKVKRPTLHTPLHTPPLPPPKQLARLAAVARLAVALPAHLATPAHHQRVHDAAQDPLRCAEHAPADRGRNQADHVRVQAALDAGLGHFERAGGGDPAAEAEGQGHDEPGGVQEEFGEAVGLKGGGVAATEGIVVAVSIIVGRGKGERGQAGAGICRRDKGEVCHAPGGGGERLRVYGGVGERERVRKRGDRGWDERVCGQAEHAGQSTGEDEQRQADGEGEEGGHADGAEHCSCGVGDGCLDDGAGGRRRYGEAVEVPVAHRCGSGGTLNAGDD